MSILGHRVYVFRLSHVHFIHVSITRPVNAAMMKVLIKFHEKRLSSDVFMNMASPRGILVALSISVSLEILSNSSLEIVVKGSCQGMSKTFSELEALHLASVSKANKLKLVAPKSSSFCRLFFSPRKQTCQNPQSSSFVENRLYL